MNLTTNQSPLIKAEVFSEFLLEQIIQGTLPDGLFRNVSDFGDGETLFIPVMGETTLRDYAEDTPVQYDAVDTGQISLTITDYVSAASYVTRKLQQDGYKAAALEAQIPKDHFRLIRERFETQMLATSNKQTLGNPNTINNFAHRWTAQVGTSAGVIGLEDFLYMKLAFDKAYIPENGRVAIVDPIVEAAVNKLAAGQAFNYNPQFQGIVLTGFEGAMRFVRNIFGWDIWVSNRLPRIASETINGGPGGASTTITSGVANVFMCVTDDQFKPFMGAWRQMPKTDGEFNKDYQRDEYVTTARWGFGLQRPESLGVVITSQTAYK
jgi:hypothetical protein